MCLIPRFEDSDKPWNDSRIRWKVMRKNSNDKFRGDIYDYGYELNKWNVSICFRALRIFLGEHISYNTAFHVFTNKQDAIRLAKHYTSVFREDYYVVMVQVKDFVCSGHSSAHDYHSETWNKLRILETYRYYYNHKINQVISPFVEK